MFFLARISSRFLSLTFVFVLSAPLQAEENKKPQVALEKDKEAASSPSSMSIFGSTGLRIEGICISPDKAYQKKFTGVTPTEVNFDYRIERCEVKGKGEKMGHFHVKFFSDRRLVYHRDEIESTAGVEFKIPFD